MEAPYKLAVAHEEMNSRRRNTMEDCHRILPNLSELPGYSYFAIYDGHGGRQIVDFLKDSLENNIATELKLLDDSLISERLTRAFLITDMESKKLNIATSGATAVSVLLRCTSDCNKINQKVLYVANVGDSRAVLVSSLQPNGVEFEHTTNGYGATRLSFDHGADVLSEQQRIKEAGGFITRNRVLGILAVSRSFGDHGMKEFVTAEPYTSETNLLKCGDCPILILACDGVWDVFSDQEAADFLLEIYCVEGPFERAAELLVNAAIEKGSADNVTFVVGFL